jgi:hypothetical protein
MPEHRILTLLLEGALFEDRKYILSRETKLSVLNVYIENCLGNRVFNTRRLA